MTKRTSIHAVLLLGTFIAFTSCTREKPAAQASDGTEWLHGTTDERFRSVAKHLRGLDVTMMEMGYRYAELYFAGQDGNWQYAGYQLKKLQAAMSNGVERRPKRAQSAKVLEGPLAALREAIQSSDSKLFGDRFEGLTAACNSCHQMEQVPFMKVVPPTSRPSPLRFTQGSSEEP
ncbi:MAG: hypothetical protein HY698_02965 [Deltaproteobacteria bacterium]|nr:hypothetical protein [Deltaproteobacteria bacterium]